jgi:hypothetical protein
LLEKPFSLERFAGDPIEQVCIYLRANHLHEIAGETIAIGGVYVEHANTRIKPQRGGSQPGFGFKHGVKIVEHRIRRVDR